MIKGILLALAALESGTLAANVDIDSTSADAASVFNPRPSPEKLYSHVAMKEQIYCEPRKNTCSPQCPTARWDARTQRIFFGWTPDTTGCNPMFKPEKTVMFLYTFYEYIDPS